MISKDIYMVCVLLQGISVSIDRYENAFLERGYQPMTGYDVETADNKESILRRIRVAREELLKISKAIKSGDII